MDQLDRGLRQRTAEMLVDREARSKRPWTPPGRSGCGSSAALVALLVLAVTTTILLPGA